MDPVLNRPVDFVTSIRSVLLAALFGSLAVLSAIAHDGLLTIDEPVSDLIRGDSLTRLFGIITTIGATETAIATAVVISLLLWRRCRTLAVLYPLTLLVGALVNVGLKAIIGRPRPPAPDTGVALASFPSGHTLQTTLLLGMLPLAVHVFDPRSSVLRTVAIASGCGVFAVGLSRVYLGAHWPTDVVGGVLVGLALIHGARLVISRHRVHHGCTCALAVGPRPRPT